MRASARMWLVAVGAVVCSACSDDSLPRIHDTYVDPIDGRDGGMLPLDDEPGSGGSQEGSSPCRPAAAEPVPARADLPQAAGVQNEKLVTTADLFESFSRSCASCHVLASMGNLQIPEARFFAERLPDNVLERMRSEQLALIMPPEGKLLSERPANDPLHELTFLLEAWIKAGKPESFADPRSVGAPTLDTSAPFLVSPALGSSLTNLGSCIPDKSIVNTETERTAELDTLFAEMQQTTLPKKLSETDLFTLDSAELARHGVLSYAPGYTLWADDAKKMRYVRVPRGASIAFSVAKQNFEVPDNTRFYKTFLKEVKDKNGQVGFRKMETRLIVVRHAIEQMSGNAAIQALYGSYRWNEDETEAELVQKPLRNGDMFADDAFEYTKDVALEQMLRAADPIDLQEQLFDQGARRTYAIPGSERCVQCHMGGQDGAFTLGFSPLQIMRRPMGEGGVIEPALADELNQLERLIDYGLITGVASRAKIVPLEKSQGARSPRNEQELIAQGYMLGNCAHCHNPLGYPSVTAPVLSDLLSFYPNAEGGGVFEFPLERVSPRIQRHSKGDGRSIAVPYITPSIYDYASTQQPYSFSALREKGESPVPAPWRSLIYRNVDAPFHYSDGDTIYPHMPMNTPGFDCRAPRIMGDWMVSIPARSRNGQTVFKETLPVKPGDPVIAVALVPDNDERDLPFEEVKPGTPEFENAQRLAAVRLDIYHQGERYRGCPDTSDIKDPNAIATNPTRSINSVLDTRTAPLGIPKRPHWIETDNTDLPGSWMPRNSSWHKVLVDNDFGSIDASKRAEQTALVTMLQTRHVTPALRSLALEEVPFGLWSSKPGCDFSSVPKLGSFLKDDRWTWLESRRATQGEAPVYMQSPGSAIFTMVCSNCHGAEADSRGRQADTVQLLSGGQTRVANFRSGLFGPQAMPGEARKSVFGEVSSSSTSIDDWTARYMAWMALGGTSAVIPTTVLNVVGANPVLGVAVSRNTEASPNMLNVAVNVCGSLLPVQGGGLSDVVRVSRATRMLGVSHTVITDNGDADMWRRICNVDNLAPIRAVRPSNWDTGVDGTHPLELLQVRATYRRTDASGRSSYPSDAPVVDQTGNIQRGVSADNRAPWCLIRPVLSDFIKEDPQQSLARALQLVQEDAQGRPALPFCPEALFEKDASGVELHRQTESDQRAWAKQGAVNAGFAVFTYLDAFTRGDVKSRPDYNQCEKLKLAP